VVELGFDSHTLHTGDSIIFDSMTPHRLVNCSPGPLQAVWAVLNQPEEEQGSSGMILPMTIPIEFAPEILKELYYHRYHHLAPLVQRRMDAL
jgi:hypothetical protein